MSTVEDLRVSIHKRDHGEAHAQIMEIRDARWKGLKPTPKKKKQTKKTETKPKASEVVKGLTPEQAKELLKELGEDE